VHGENDDIAAACRLDINRGNAVAETPCELFQRLRAAAVAKAASMPAAWKRSASAVPILPVPMMAMLGM
jgi:hypothetical protein